MRRERFEIRNINYNIYYYCTNLDPHTTYIPDPDKWLTELLQIALKNICELSRHNNSYRQLWNKVKYNFQPKFNFLTIKGNKPRFKKYLLSKSIFFLLSFFFVIYTRVLILLNVFMYFVFVYKNNPWPWVREVYWVRLTVN